jgi:hypothetical protein
VTGIIQIGLGPFGELRVDGLEVVNELFERKLAKGVV